MLHLLGISKVDHDQMQELRNPNLSMRQFRRNVTSIGTSLYRFAVREANLPGQELIYTVVVMPSGIGLWAGALGEGLVSETGFVYAKPGKDPSKVTFGMDTTRKALSGYTVLIIDTMLERANTLSAVISLMERSRPKRVVVMSLLAVQDAVEKLQADHPDVDIVVGKIDETFDAEGFGHAGRRLFGHRN